MVKVTPDPPNTAPIFDKAVVKRAMACYLPVPRSPREPHDSKFDFISLEATLVHALDFLRCASELGDELTGSQRDLAFASMHMVEMAKVMIERSVECVEEV
ncbi:hypothetical protein A264_03520 [Pseudomonas syringae pv. actinidiae ICMP 19071]|uniref:DUF6124 family protein n=1 Tax=Pseudomonas syringae TaxID=317 RepID=UPI0003570044|nr:hypothetical protein [Pseudomonas syringae]EPM48779.1 hypothetical protein A262_23925 [Pseudomonas syringae pv. actinidiae ICMP 19073]EPM62324.1 hypothetical protein A264_03520 [Pseudomonas syringae pv. actinidiae ICMP 19071]EPM80130.1 hypothetical protein A3SO_03439 [Pseudomonas syringae pv. actinidiae ICMP 19072]OSN64325.1 hypothetical protein BV349_03891 [Pseudomonas syringae pv. actinidiae]OSN75382.1 hypothetical protein BV351_03755 [Pseudomonas syringae pv. actinidiae]